MSRGPFPRPGPVIGQESVSEYEYISHPWNSMHQSQFSDWRLAPRHDVYPSHTQRSCIPTAYELMHAGVKLGLALIMCLLVPE